MIYFSRYLPLHLCLTDTEDTHPEKGISEDDSPGRVSLSGVQITNEELDPPVLIVAVEYCPGAPSLRRGQGHDDEDGEDHEDQLEHVSPHHRLHPAHRGVEHADDEDCGAAHVHVETHHLLEGQGRGVDHDGDVEHHGQAVHGAAEHLDWATEPELQILVTGLELEPVEGGDVDPARDPDEEGGHGDDEEDHGALGVHLRRDPQQGQGRHEASRDARSHRNHAQVPAA